ncbi:MAG: hypothetical protein NTW26_07655 [bacterium]|nr:hypothetical protein [bacterium]
MKSFAFIILAFTAAMAANVAPMDPFLEEIPFGANAGAVLDAMTDAGYTQQESSDEICIGVRGDERLEYRFSGDSQTFAEYTLQGPSSVALEGKLGTWTERICKVWDNPAAMSTDGSKLWIVPGMYTIALHIEGADLLVTVTWD